jgi:Ser/Thr protein kinase RdoA (MazF antagonist)
MTNVTSTESAAIDLAWAERTLRGRFGSALRMGRVAQLPARTGRLHCLDATLGDQPRRFFLKHYKPAAVPTWAEHAEHLGLISRTFDSIEGLLGSTLIAADVERNVSLAAEVPGDALSRAVDQSVVWHGIGRWLGALHRSRRSECSTTHAAKLAAFAEKRFRVWSERDRSMAGLADRAIEAVSQVLPRVGSAVSTVLCHGDVTIGNIRVQRGAVGLIDFDDVRMDMPAVDLSQAELLLEDLGYVGTVVPIRGAAARARAAFREGYGGGYAAGPEFWLPHLRNLSVFLLTLAERRRESLWHRLNNEMHYRRTVASLERTISDIRCWQPAAHRGLHVSRASRVSLS